MEIFEDGRLKVVIAGPAGFGNNIYVVVDSQTNAAAFVDAPDDVAQSIAAAESVGVKPTMILLTHSHPDHTASLDALKAKYGCKVYGDVREPWLKDGQLNVTVHHGDEVMVGELTFRVLSVPGHTPGSTTFVHGRHAFVGDTLFPGGPGRSQTNANLLQEIESIRTHLYALPEETTIWPGHGARATIGQSKKEYAVFAAKQHSPELKGDVSWLDS